MIELIQHRAYEQISWLPDIVVEYVVLRNTTGESSLASHRRAALAGMHTLASRLDKYYTDLIRLRPGCRHYNRNDFFKITWDETKMSATPYDTESLFSPVWQRGEHPIGGYAHAFMDPPYGHKYTLDDFRLLNEALFTPPVAGTTRAYRWSTDWSNYFEAGLEWWGAYYWTVYDTVTDIFVAIAASSSD